MKHLLNNLTEEEKNKIREQHGIKIATDKFKNLLSEQSYQPKKVDLGVPYDNPLYQELQNWVTGDGPEVLEYIPKKKLVIGTKDGNKVVPSHTIIQHT